MIPLLLLAASVNCDVSVWRTRTETRMTRCFFNEVVTGVDPTFGIYCSKIRVRCPLNESAKINKEIGEENNYPLFGGKPLERKPDLGDAWFKQNDVVGKDEKAGD